jgi:serine protease Do
MKLRYAPLAVAAVAAAVSLHVASASHDPDQPAAVAMTTSRFREVARHQNPTVVSIAARRHQRSWNRLDDEMFRFFGLTPPAAGEFETRAAASGFLISGAGDILTNYHVVEGAESFAVSLFDDHRRRYRATLVGGDPLTDIAVIRLVNPPAYLPVAPLGDSSTLGPGDWVLAIGNPYELGHTVTLGVVSCERRPFQMYDGHWEDLIQTDASINAGSSGGPLINVRGEVVGMSVAVLDSATGNNTGIGFAIPINTVKALLPQLLTGRVVRGRLDLDLREGRILDDEALALGLPEPRGAIVMSVDGESRAASAGLRAGDVIVELDGHPIVDAYDLLARVSATPPGTSVTVTAYRNGVEATRRLVVDARPVAPAADRPARSQPGDRGLTLGAMRPSAPGRSDAPAGLTGARIVQVAPGSVGDEADLVVDDIILAVNRQPVHSAAEASDRLNRIAPDQPVFLLVWRRGIERFVQLDRN